MPDEYDAFGRKNDDAGLGDLGWGATGEAPTAQTGPPREVQTVTPVSTGLSRPRHNPAIIFIQLAVLAALIGGVALAVMSGSDAVDSARKTLDGFKVTTGADGSTITTTDEGDDTVPEQVKVDRFFTQKGLRQGLKILAKEQPGKITNFSFRKDRINVQVNRGGKSHNVQLSAGAEAPQEFSASIATSNTIKPLIYEEISSSAMAKLLRGANSRLNASVKQVDYFVVSKTLGPVQWGIYYKNGKVALGDSRGRFTRRIS